MAAVTRPGTKSIGTRIAGGGRSLLGAVNHLLWPTACAVCRQAVGEDENGLCRDCWAELMACTGGDYCPRCGVDVSRYAIVGGSCANCQGSGFHFDGIARAGVYDKALRRIILDFKKGRTELEGILTFLAESALAAGVFRQDIDFFVPVPLFWLRRLMRGFNQSHVLAKRLKPTGERINTDLVRIRHTRQQATLTSAGRRAANVAGAFAVRFGHNFTGKNVCLIDDIKTTGATLNECAKTLKEAGASKVYALVLAVAGQRKT